MIRTFTIQPHQVKILKDVKNLPLERLHYLVIQQSLKHPNLTLKEFKCRIKRGIRLYVQDLFGYEYKYGLEDEVIKYYCFFETSKEFFWSQHLNNIVDEDIDLNFHVHIFLSGKYRIVNFTQLIFYIFRELTSQKNKQRCINKFDYKKLESLEDDFVLYHTKQMMFHPNRESIIQNVIHRDKYHLV